MKNFTNLFKHKTNPLWIRLLIMTFMLLAGVIEIYGTTVYFVNKPKWSQVNVHNWNGGTGTNWPGTKATKESYQVEGCDVYKCDIGNNKNFIFSNNGSNQTSDLHIDNGTWYYDGKQYSSKETIEGSINNPHSTHTSITKFSVTNSDVIYFDATGTGWTTCYMYIGHNNYSKRFAMTRVAGTKNLWKGTSFGQWSDAQAWYFSSEDWNDITNGMNECILCKACYHTENTFLMPYKSDFTNNAIYKASANNQMYATSECYKNAWSWSSTVDTYSSSLSVSITNKVGTTNTANAGTVTIKKWNSTTSNAGSAYSTSFLSTSDATGSGTTGYLTAVRITLTASTGYELEKLTVGGTDVTSTYKTNGYYDKEITAATAIVATWKSSCTNPTISNIAIDNASVCSGSSANITVTATGATSYQLYTVNNSTYTKSGSAQASNVFTVSAAGSYAVKALNGTCESDYSATKTLTVLNPTITNISIDNTSVCSGSSANITVTATGATSYQLYTVNNSTYTKSGSAQASNVFTVSAAGSYAVKALNGTCESDYSATKTLTVLNPTITNISIDNTSVCSGSSAKITVTATGATSYQLYTVNGSTYTKSGNAQSSNVFTVSAAGSYAVKALNGTCQSGYSATKTLTVNNKPAVPTLTPSTVSLVYPETATLTAGNTTNGLTYTLYNGETPGESQVSEGRDLTFKAGDAGSYTVKVTNSCGTSTSDVVTITVCTPQTNEFRHANSSYTQLQDQPTYYPGDKAYFVSTIDCCLTGTWSANLQKGEEGWWTGLTGSTPRFSMTLTRAGEFTITNMATNGCTQDKNVLVNLDFTVTALSQVTNANGTASGADIALTWKHSANHTKVMVVRYPTAGTETIPAGGQSYSAGNTLGEGTVVYVGTSESYTDKNLPSGESYKYYFYTVNNNYYSDGVVLNMSSCPIPAKPNLSSTAITACNGECTAQGYIIIGNMGDYKDDTYTFKLGNSVVTPDANGKLGINSTAFTQYTVTVTNSCGNPNSATVDIAINDKTPTISGKTITQPGKDNAIQLTLPTGISAKWSVEPNNADLSVNEGNSTLFSAEVENDYVITANNDGCIDTHNVKVSTAFLIWVRRPMSGHASYENIYSGTSEKGSALYLEQTTSGQTYTSVDNVANRNSSAHNKIEPESSYTDCEGATWDIFRTTPEMALAGAKFYVAAKNDEKTSGYATYTKDYTFANGMTADAYFTIGGHTSGNKGSEIVLSEQPLPTNVYSSGDAKFNANNFADFVPLYVVDCSGNEVDSYQWQFSATIDGTYTNYSSECSYVGKKTETTDAGKSNNIRVKEGGYYRCIVTYKDGKGTSTSNSIKVTNTTSGTPGTLSFTSKLPIIMVNTNDLGFPVNNFGGTPSKNADKMKEKMSVDVKIYEGSTLKYDRKARMNYRGSSSLNFLKKSYAFCPGKADCVEDKGRKDYVKTEKLNMLDIGKAVDKDWVLYAAAADPSLMRNRLMFDTFRDMTSDYDPKGWSVQSRYVELIVDGEYKGVYVMMDKITANKDRVNVEWKLDANGNTTQEAFIVKFDKTDKADRYEITSGDQKTFKSKYSGHDGFDTYDTNIDQRFEVEYPEKEDIEDGKGKWSEVFNAIENKINKFEEELAKGNFSEVQKLIDYTSWADWFIITEFAKNIDGYRASNLFVYDGSKPNAKIEARPLWDQELSFNNQCPSYYADYGSNSTSGLLIDKSNSAVYNNDASAPFWFTGKYKGDRGKYNGSDQTFKGLLDDPCFVAEVQARWAKHVSGALSQATMTAKVTEYKSDLGDIATSGTPMNRELTFWKNKSRATIDCGTGSGCYDGTTGYSAYNTQASITNSATTLTNWLTGNRRTNLGNIINGWEGTGLNISLTVTPGTGITTPWEAVMVQVNNPSGYDYDLEYTTNTLDKVSGVIINENNDKYTYRIPRPEAWKPGDEEKDGERTDIQYGIKATLKVGEGVAQCGNSSQAPSATTTITLQDEANENCPK